MNGQKMVEKIAKIVQQVSRKASSRSRSLTEDAEALAMANVNSALLIAEVQEKNELIERSKQEMQKLLDHLRLAVFTITRDGKVNTPVSKHSRVVFGTDIVGKSVFETLYKDLDRAPDLSPFFDEAVAKRSRSDRLPSQVKYTISDASGSLRTRYLKSDCTPLIDRDGEVEKLMFVVEDVTEIFEYEQKLREQRELAAAARLAQLESEKKALLNDLELTGAVQNLLLPAQEAHQSENFTMAAFFQTAREASGDWWWFEPRGNEVYRILLGDVTGHGPGSAMVTAAVASSYRSLQAIQPEATASEVMQHLNRTMLGFCASRYWMTFCIVEVDAKSGRVQTWNAGAPPLLIGKSGGSVETVYFGTSSPLGSEDFVPQEKNFKIDKGDVLMAFTDGIFEFEMQDQKPFGLNRLRAAFSGVLTSVEDMGERKKSLLKTLEKERGSAELVDDSSFVIFEVK